MDTDHKIKALLSGFPVVIALPVQWGDQDAFGHVNNTVYFRWFESGRIAYSLRTGLLDLMHQEKIGPILASSSCDYRRQVTFPDTVHIGMKVVRVGRSSLGMEHIIVSQNEQAIAAEGTSTIVVFDYRANKSHPLPARIRHAIETLEGRKFD